MKIIESFFVNPYFFLPDGPSSENVNGDPSSSLVTYSPGSKDKVNRKIKTTTDGERYMTQSMTEEQGQKMLTTEGVNNKTTKSIEIIGG